LSLFRANYQLPLAPPPPESPPPKSLLDELSLELLAEDDPELLAPHCQPLELDPDSLSPSSSPSCA
jgi:hypothetical protein